MYELSVVDMFDVVEVVPECLQENCHHLYGGLFSLNRFGGNVLMRW